MSPVNVVRIRSFICLVISAALIIFLLAMSPSTASAANSTSHGTIVAAGDGCVVAGKVDFSVGSVLYLLKVDSAGNEVWSRTYGEYSGFGEVRSLAAADDGYLIASTLGTANGTCIYLLKTDLGGNPVWGKAYGEPNLTYAINSVIAVPDGFVLTGNAGPFPWHGVSSYPWDTTRHTYLLKVNHSGDLSWYHVYDSPGYDNGNSVMAVCDGYVIAGSFSTSHEAAATYIVKTDLDGNEVWNLTRIPVSSSGAYSIAPASAGYIVSGFSWFYHPNMAPPDYNRGYLVKVSPDGQILEESLYNVTGGADDGRFIEAVGDGYVIAGTADTYGNHSVYLMKSDLHGLETWNKTYPGIKDDLSGLIVVDDGYVMAGPVNLKGYWTGYLRLDDTDLHLFKADLNGNILWDRTYESVIARERPVGSPGNSWSPTGITPSPMPLSTPAPTPSPMPGATIYTVSIAAGIAALLMVLGKSFRGTGK